MAQAPGGPSGAPRQNKTIKDFKGMNTQNSRNAIPEGTFAWLENIQPIGPAHLHSIPGRGSSVVRIPPLIPPEECTDATLRGQADISIETRFDQFSSFPPFGNLRTSWGYINSAEEVWTLIGNAAGSGGNMAYFATDCQLNHYQGPLILTHPALINPDPFKPALNTFMGTSDEPIYGFSGHPNHFYFPNSSTEVGYFVPAGFIQVTGEFFFCKKGTSMYLPVHSTTPPFDHHIVEYSAAGGTELNNFASLPQFVHSQISATDGFLYVLATEIADPTKVSVKKISRVNGVVSATFMLDQISPALIGVVNDNLIYVLCLGASAALYYIENFNTLVYVGTTVGQGFVPLGTQTGMFVGGALYYGANGFAGFTTDIFKITVACPPGSPASPVIASATRGSNSVAAGANILVSWADVLLPVANDHIWLLPAPTPPDLGIIAADLVVSRITDGLGTSSMNFLIPLATPPGSYILAFMANDAIYVAKTATFTVT